MQRRNAQDNMGRLVRWVFAANLVVSFLKFESAVCSSFTAHDPPITLQTVEVVFDRAEYSRDFFPSTDILRHAKPAPSPFLVFAGLPKDRFPRGKPNLMLSRLVQLQFDGPPFLAILQKKHIWHRSTDDDPHRLS